MANIQSPPSLNATEKFLTFSENITNAHTLDDLYAISVQEICSNLSCDFSFIYLLTKEDTYQLECVEGAKNFPLKNIYERDEDWFGKWWGRNKKIKSLIKTKVRNKRGTNKIIAFPISNTVRTFGVIGAICQQEHIDEFTERDIERLRIYTRIISLAATSKKEANKLSFVLDTFKLVRQKSDEKEMFQLIADQLAQKYPKFNACLIHLYDDVRKNLYGYVSSGIEYKISGSSRIEIGENIIGTAYVSGKKVARTDTTDFIYQAWAKRNQFKSMISIRLDDVNKKPYGVLSVFTKYSYEEDKKDEKFLENFINQTSTLISSIIHEKRIKKLTTIDTIISEIIPFEKSLEYILQTFLRRSLESLGGEVGFISLYPKDSDIIYGNYIAISNEKFKYVKVADNLNLMDKDSLTSWVYINRKPYLYPSYTETDNITRSYLNIEDQIQTEMVVPLIYQEDFIGVIILSSTIKFAFNYEDLEFLESIAQKAAQVIQSKRFHDASLKLNQFKYEKLDEKVIFEETVKITNEILETPMCCIWKLEKDDDGLETLNLLGLEGIGAKSQDMDMLQPVRAGEGGFSWEIINKARENLDEVVCKLYDNIQDTKSGFKHTQFARDYNLKSMISIPIIHNEKVYGVINAYTKTKYTFFEHEKILLSNLAIRCGATLYNAQLKRQHEDLLEKWTNINTIANPGMVALTFIHDIGHYIHYLNSDIGMLKEFIKQKSRNTKAINSMLDSATASSRSISKSFSSLVRIGKRVKSKKKPHSLKKIIEQVKPLFQRRFERNKIKFSYFFSGHEDIIVNCYPNEIEQLLVNLTLNAVTALGTKPHRIKEITIKAAHFTDNDNKKWIRIEYSDNGCGMKKEDIRKVFETNFSTKEDEGSGFGLSICKRIVEKNHNGKINLYSVLGKETVFCVYLPI